MIYARALGDALGQLLAEDDRVVLLGEDIADPYGGAFKVTRGLSTAFPDRVRTTPISEAGVVGLATGLALHGMRPIAEIMFGDFLTLTFDQLVNHAAKYGAMYDGQAAAPVIVRSPSGGGRGYGPTHSQSLEQHFLGVPHLRVHAASPFHAPYESLAWLLDQDDPALFVEHKLLYPKPLQLASQGRVAGAIALKDADPGAPPTVTLSYVPRDRCTFTVLAYGHQAVLALEAMRVLAIEEEIFGELLVPSSLSPMDWGPVTRSVAQTGRLLTVEEGTEGWSWGDGVAAEISRRVWSDLRAPVQVLTSAADIVPSSRTLEQEVLVGTAKITRAMREAA